MRYGTASNFSKVTIVFVTSSSSVIVPHKEAKVVLLR